MNCRGVFCGKGLFSIADNLPFPPIMFNVACLDWPLSLSQLTCSLMISQWLVPDTDLVLHVQSAESETCSPTPKSADVVILQNLNLASYDVQIEALEVGLCRAMPPSLELILCSLSGRSGYLHPPALSQHRKASAWPLYNLLLGLV